MSVLESHLMDKLQLFMESPMTASSVEFLAEMSGEGASVEEFAGRFPENARVIDVGAGLSNFGSHIAKLRHDIRWTNLDPHYENPGPQANLLASAKDNAPENVEFLAGNVFELDPSLLGQYDRVFSYNMISHMLRFDRNLGRTAINSMLGLLKPDGQLSVGPTNGKMATADRWKTVTLPANATEEDIAKAEKLLTSPRLAGRYYDASLVSGVGAYPKKRFNPDAGKGIVLSDDGGQTTHSLLSPRGLQLAARLAAGALRA